MKGFTLIETLIYTALSASVAAASLSFLFSYSDANIAYTRILETEMDGLTALVILSQKIEDKDTLNLAAFEQDYGLKLLKVTASSSGLTTISFIKNDVEFVNSLYVPH